MDIDHMKIKELLTEALKLTPEEQYRLAFFIAENIHHYLVKNEKDD